MIETPIQMRFADADMLAHVNNVNQQHYFDVGKSAFFKQLLGLEPGFLTEGMITVSTAVSYFHQIRLGTPLVARTWVLQVGTKSFRLLQRLVDTGSEQVMSEAESVMVAFDFSAQSSIEVPAAWRTALLTQADPIPPRA